MNRQPSGYSVRGPRQRRVRESDEQVRPRERPLLGKRLPAVNGVPLRRTIVVCLNYQRFVEFCAQENLNPRSRQFIVVSGVHDVHKVRGLIEFDVVFLTHYDQINGIYEIKNDILARMAHPQYKGSFYYLET